MASRSRLSGLGGVDSGEATEARSRVAAHDRPPGLRRMGGDDQVMGAARGTGPADMSEKAPVMGCRRLGVIKDVNGRGDQG
jgi:hypothetical protein